MDSLWQHDLTSAQLPELLASDAQTTADAQHIMPALPPVTVIVCFSPLACALHGAIQLCRRLPPFVPICLPISVLLVLLRLLEPSLDEEGDLVRRDMAW